MLYKWFGGNYGFNLGKTGVFTKFRIMKEYFHCLLLDVFHLIAFSI